MKASKHVRRVRRHHARLRGRHDLNIVPMIDMMIIMLFFLIFTAVFSKTSILELNLPAANASVVEPPEGLQLEVIVRQGALEVADRSTGLLQALPSTNGAYDYAGLSAYLQRVKARYPEHQAATILLDPAIPYDVLVQVMDTVRVFEVTDRDRNGGQFIRAELFPEISVGDAPT